MAETSVAPEGSPFQQVRPLTSERAQLVTRTAESLAERYQEELGRWLSDVTVQAEQIEQVSLPAIAGEETDLAVVKAHYHLTQGLVVTDLSLALAICERLCGGAGEAPPEVRPLSRLETGVINLVLEPLVDAAADLFDVGPMEIGHHFATAAFLPESVDDHGIAVQLKIHIGSIEGQMTLGLSLGQLQRYNEDIDRRLAGRLSNGRRGPSAETIRAVQPIEVDLVVGFEPMRVPANTLAELQVGDVLRTGQSVSKNLLARVGREPIFHVRAAQRGQRLVAELITPIELDRGPQ